jgi:ArsR family transcriptional regulator
MPVPFVSAVAALRAAGEPTRLRLLALLAQGELTVGEICEIVGQSQPRVSRHLKLLADAGLVDRFREQHWVYYRAPVADPGQRTLRQILGLVDTEDEPLARDRKRLEQVLAARVTAAARDAASTAASEVVDAIVVSELADAPIGTLLDVGTGEGHYLELLAPQAKRAVGVDISSDALRVARTNVHGAGLAHCELQRGDMYDLPFSAAVFDTATLDRALATAARPTAALREIARALKPGGRLVVIEDFDALAAAGQANPIRTLRDWFAAAGLACSRLRPIDTEAGHLLLAVATVQRPASAAA